MDEIYAECRHLENIFKRCNKSVYPMQRRAHATPGPAQSRGADKFLGFRERINAKHAAWVFAASVAVFRRDGRQTAASKVLCISALSTSTAVAELAVSLGVQLFIRHHASGLSMTRAGREILAKTRERGVEAPAVGLDRNVGFEAENYLDLNRITNRLGNLAGIVGKAAGMLNLLFNAVDDIGRDVQLYIGFLAQRVIDAPVARLGRIETEKGKCKCK